MQSSAHDLENHNGAHDASDKRLVNVRRLMLVEQMGKLLGNDNMKEEKT